MIIKYPLAHRRRPGAEFGWDRKQFRRPRFLNDFFLGKKFPFSRQKLLMTFLVIDHVFQIFSIFFRFSISLLCEMSYNVIYYPFFTRKPPISENKLNFLMTPFFTRFVLSRASDNTTSQNIGGTDAWTVPPTSNLGDRPPAPPKSPPVPL